MGHAEGVPEPLPVTILTWIKGRVLQQNERKLRDFVHLGRLVGQLHDHVSKWTPPERPDRRTYDAKGVMGPQAAYSLEGLSRDNLPDEVREGLRTVFGRLRVIEEELGRALSGEQLVHLPCFWRCRRWAA